MVTFENHVCVKGKNSSFHIPTGARLLCKIASSFFAHLISQNAKATEKREKSWRSRQELSTGNECIFWSTKIRLFKKFPESH